MSFPIVLQENSSAMIVVDKQIADVATATGTLREGCSIVDPVIEIESSLEADILARVNYAYIALFHRYYYITDIYLDINKLWTISMHTDVLMSYKSQIRLQNAIVARQERRYNMYLDDGWFMTYQNPEVVDKYFSNPTPFESQEYVLVLAGS